MGCTRHAQRHDARHSQRTCTPGERVQAQSTEAASRGLAFGQPAEGEDKDSGLLGHRLTFGAGGPLLVQYWNSPEKLYHYASDRTAAHRPGWAAFNRRARKAPGAVGIWHETYLVEPAKSIYSGMPVSGLAAATSSVPVARRGETAAERLHARQPASVGAISAGQRLE